MDKLTFKKQVHAAALADIQQKITGLQREMTRLQGNEFAGEAESFDLVQTSQNEAAHELTNKLSATLQAAMEEQNTLERMEVQEPLAEKVGAGALVMTNKGNFYISVPTDRLTVDGEKVIGISPEAPIYRAMHEKEAGDTFAFRNIHYKIKKVF